MLFAGASAKMYESSLFFAGGLYLRSCCCCAMEMPGLENQFVLVG